MERQPPSSASDEIDLYIRTYYSLLRSSGEVRVRAFEEAHMYSDSSLHLGAREAQADVAAFAYSAARLPECMLKVRRIVLGQSHEHFEAAGIPVADWVTVRSRGRRRPLRWDGGETLAVFITSTTDIDDLVPIVTAWQIEWNKLHSRLSESSLGRGLADQGAPATTAPLPSDTDLCAALGLDEGDLGKLRGALGSHWMEAIGELARRESNLSMQLLNGSFSQYQRAAQRWWSGIEPDYLQTARPRRRPIYFISSNTHSLSNLLGGYAARHREEMIHFASEKDPEGLAQPLGDAVARGDEHAIANLTYYMMRIWLHQGGPDRLSDVQRFDGESGIVSIETPGKIDVGAQIIDLSQLRPERIDPRVLEGLGASVDALRESEAVIVNIDYPLGMAAYHHLSRLAQGVGDLRGLYVMGKAATLNGRVGDVMISTVAHDEHSGNTYLFRNCFVAADVQPWVREASVFDGQKALTVRGAFLQNRQYMSVFYREGYSVIEMEAGPYLSAIYEIVSPKRHPEDQIVHLSNITPFDVGIIHYASDTPYSRRQTLLSKSLSYFGVDSTYGSAIAILRRIFKSEIDRAGK